LLEPTSEYGVGFLCKKKPLLRGGDRCESIQKGEKGGKEATLPVILNIE
jgi:hypothetical protein